MGACKNKNKHPTNARVIKKTNNLTALEFYEI
jgi:hypothetical protein